MSTGQLPDLPFANNSCDVAAQVARAHFDAQCRGFRAAIYVGAGLNLPLLQNDTVIDTNVVYTLSTQGVQVQVLENLRAPAPPGLVEFLLLLLVKSKQSQAMVGDLNETFARECIQMGRARAARRYCAEALRSLLPMLLREACRALKWLAILDALVRRL